MHPYKTINRFQRVLRAQWRDAAVLLRESGGALILFFGLVLGGAFLFYLSYTDPVTGSRVRFGEALYGAFALLFFQDALSFPKQWYLQALYFIIPILGLIVVVDGVIRFGVALTNKKDRGQKWQIAMASTYKDHVIVCGLGKVGYRVTLELLKFDREVIVIEENPDGRFIEKVKSLDVPVILADARRTETLIKAGIKQADAIIPCTNNELANLDIALDAREIRPEIKVVMRMYDADLARRVEKGFGIHTALSTSALAAPVFAASAMRVNVKSSFYVGEELLNISELSIGTGSSLQGWRIQELEERLSLDVVAYIENGVSHLHPNANIKLGTGCQLLILASLESLHRLNKLNRPNESK
jgi:Trk K+ transport system NAD-binding subunit